MLNALTFKHFEHFIPLTMYFTKLTNKYKRRLLNPAEKADILDDTAWGNGFEWSEISFMAKYFDAYDIEPNTMILKEGQSSEPYMGLIISGRVMITKETLHGKNRVLAHIPKGKTFGEMSLIDGLPSSASVETESEAFILLMDKQNFDKLLHDSPALANKFLFKLLRLLSARLRETSGKLVDFLEKE